ncbi:unnamed protein product [Prorocentrum cordatum]|uniref:Uncharacterized protein n=1 Tax=Prorocentrum cordatum TaxID=2364126 RepID=A0ABN9Y886_9DINO|nr:unnamed protein product [Polarella glacialis]
MALGDRAASPMHRRCVSMGSPIFSVPTSPMRRDHSTPHLFGNAAAGTFCRKAPSPFHTAFSCSFPSYILLLLPELTVGARGSATCPVGAILSSDAADTDSGK